MSKTHQFWLLKCEYFYKSELKIVEFWTVVRTRQAMCIDLHEHEKTIYSLFEKIIGRLIDNDNPATPAFIYLTQTLKVFISIKVNHVLCFLSSTVTSCKLRLISANAFQYNLKLQYV